jgi:general secretion pathway protein C
MTPRRPSEDTIAHVTPSLVLRLALGAGQLGALYLATHAIGAFSGWKVMADAEPFEATEPEDDEDADAAADDAEDEAKSKPPIPTVKTQPDARLTRITRFNAFCPTCAPSEEVVAAAAAADGMPLPPGLELAVGDLELPQAVRTELPIALLATMEARAPGISLATLSQQDGTTGIYAVGEEVLPSVELVAVDLGIVYLDNQGRVEYLQVSSDDPPPVPKAPDEEGEEEDEKPKKSANEIEGASDAISCNGTSCTVERKFVDQLLANPAVLASQGNARPYARDDLKGFRLSRVKNGTLPRMLGLRSGDVITAVNGQPLDSLDGAMKLYAKLRNAAHLTIDVTRNKAGERQEIRLDVSIL